MPLTVREPEVAIPRVCSGCNRYGHNKRTCLFSEATPIDKLGVEIEGMWLNRTRFDEVQRIARNMTGGVGYRDGSVQATSADIRENPDASQYFVWEFQTRPGNVNETLTQVQALFPDFTNASCGMHVHMSFHDPLSASLLTTKRFFQYIEGALAAFGNQHQIASADPFWNRISGHNQYCRLNSNDPSNQDWFGNTDRYRVVNFTSWNEHKTVEFRVLPMFSSLNLTLESIKFLFKAVDRFLRIEAQELLQSLIPAQMSLPIMEGSHLVLEGALVDTTHDFQDAEISNLDVPAPIENPTPGHITVPWWNAVNYVNDAIWRMNPADRRARERQQRNTPEPW